MKAFAKDLISKLTHTNFFCFSSKNAPLPIQAEKNSDCDITRSEIKGKKTFLKKKSKLMVSGPTDFDKKAITSDFHSADKGATTPVPGFSREELPLRVYMTHQELVDQAMINRKYANQYYIYDAEQFDGPVNNEILVDAGYNIFDAAKDPLNPNSCRYVIHHLVLKFKTLLTLENEACDNVVNFWEKFVQTSSESNRNILKDKVKQLFPWRGCTLQGEIMDRKLDELFGSNVVEVLEALIMIWTEFPCGVVPWSSFAEFAKLECNAQYPVDFFYKKFPECLPDHDYTCVCFEFLEMLRHFVTIHALRCKKKVVDWVMCCATVCFTMKEKKTVGGFFKNVQEWLAVRTKHGEALYHIFLSYLRSLYAENKLKDFYLAEEFDIFDGYPQGVMDRLGLGNSDAEQVGTSLCISVSQHSESFSGKYATACVTEQIILHCSQAAQHRSYNANHIFNNTENDFLNAFSKDPEFVFQSLVNEDTLKRLQVVDPLFNKKLPFCMGHLAEQENNKPTLRKFYFPQDSQYRVANWIDVGFEHNDAEFFLHSLECSNVNDKEEESGTAFVSKINMNRWLNNTLNFDVFHENIVNTVSLHFDMQIGECTQLILFLDGQIKRVVVPATEDEDVCEKESSLHSRELNCNYTEEESASVMCRPSIDLVDSLSESRVSCISSDEITNSESKPVPVRIHPYRGSSVSLLLGGALEGTTVQEPLQFSVAEAHYKAFVASM